MDIAKAYISLLKDSIVDPITQDEVEEILNRAYNDKLFPTVYSRLLLHGYGLSQEWKIKYEESLVEMRTISSELKRIWPMLIREGYEPVLVKGFALSKQIFGKEDARYFWDLDILFPSSCNISEVYQKMMTLGYYQYMLYNDGTNGSVKDTQGYLEYSVEYHEIHVINETSQIMPVYAELKSSTSVLPEELVNSFIKHSIAIDLFGGQYRTFDTIHSFIHTCLNAVEYDNNSMIFFNKSRIKLRNFYDLYEFVRNHDINVQDLQTYGSEYGLLSQVKRALCETADLFRDIKCRDLSNQLTPGENKRHISLQTSFPSIFSEGRRSDFPGIEWNASIEARIFSEDNGFSLGSKALKKMLYSNSNPDYKTAQTIRGNMMKVQLADTLISYTISFLQDFSGFKVTINHETIENGLMSRAILRIVNPELESRNILWKFFIGATDTEDVFVSCDFLEVNERLEVASTICEDGSVEITVKFPSPLSQLLMGVGRVVSLFEIAKKVYPHVYVTQGCVSSVVIYD